MATSTVAKAMADKEADEIDTADSEFGVGTLRCGVRVNGGQRSALSLPPNGPWGLPHPALAGPSHWDGLIIARIFKCGKRPHSCYFFRPGGTIEVRHTHDGRARCP